MMTEIQKYEPGNLDDLQRTAKMLVASGYFDAKGDANQQIAQMATKVMAGAELGYGPFASVNGIHVVNGKPSVGANLIASAVKSHPRYNYRVRKLDNTGCTIEFFEDGESCGVSEFTEEDAQAAGLLTGKNGHTWKSYRRNMLFARAISNGMRWFCPDVFSGNSVYVPEELGAEVDGDGNVIDGGWHEVQQQQPEPKVPGPSTEQEKRDAHEHNRRTFEGALQTSDTDDVQFMNGDSDGKAAAHADNPFESDEPEPEQESNIARLRRQFHATGTEVYADAWDDKRHELVQRISGGKKTSSNELTEKQLERLISGMQEKRQQAEVA